MQDTALRPNFYNLSHLFKDSSTFRLRLSVYGERFRATIPAQLVQLFYKRH